METNISESRNMEAMTQYLRRTISNEEESEVVILSFDQNLPQLKQIGTSVADTQRHILKSNGFIYPPLKGNENHKSKKLLYEVLQQLQRDGLVYVADNLSVSANISKPKPVPQPDNVILDVCLLLQGLPPTVLTLVEDDAVPLEKAREYNLTLVQGVIKTVRRFSMEQFSAVYGLIEEHDLANVDVFIKRLESLHEEASPLYIPDSLKMQGRKCEDIICAFITSVALTSSVVNKDNSDTLWFLTLDQFCILTENIDQREVIVRTTPSSGGKVLMREVARRLERDQKTCKHIFTSEEWRKKISERKYPEDICNMVTDCHDCSPLPGLKGKSWTFLLERGMSCASVSLKVEEVTRDEESKKDTPEEELLSVSEMDSTCEEDSGYYSSMSSVARSRTASLSSQESLGTTGRQSPQKGFLKKIKRRLSLPGTRREKHAKPTYFTPDGPVFFLTDEENMNPVPLICRQQEMDRVRVNVAKSNVTSDGLLVNTKPTTGDLQGSLRFKQHYGTCSTLCIPLPLSPSSATFVPPASHYLETETIVVLKKKLEWMTLLEVGVMEESHIDGGGRSYYRPRSSCVRVGRCEAHNMEICKQVWHQGEHIQCVTTIPGMSYKLRYGVVVDVVCGKVGLIDVNKGVVLGTFDDEFKENLFPVFSIYPDPNEAMVQMKIIRVNDIAMTEEKQKMIYSCLT